jgi:hypothetical protein
MAKPPTGRNVPDDPKFAPTYSAAHGSAEPLQDAATLPQQSADSDQIEAKTAVIKA